MYYYCMRPLRFVSVRCVSFLLIFAQFAEFVPFDRIPNSTSSYSPALTNSRFHEPLRLQRTDSQPKSKYSVWDSMYLLFFLLFRCFNVTLSASLQQENFISLNELSKYNICEGNSPREMIHFIRKYFMTRF